MSHLHNKVQNIIDWISLVIILVLAISPIILI